MFYLQQILGKCKEPLLKKLLGFKFRKKKKTFLCMLYKLFVSSVKCMNARSWIQTCDLTVCLYLNLKHGELDHLATMAGSLKIVIAFAVVNDYRSERLLKQPLKCSL